MQYMIIEKFKEGKVKELYRRFEEKGRLAPVGLNYINSWITQDITVCYQIMETDDLSKLHQWINNWNDLVEFEIIPVITSQQAREKVFEN